MLARDRSALRRRRRELLLTRDWRALGRRRRELLLARDRRADRHGRSDGSAHRRALGAGRGRGELLLARDWRALRRGRRQLLLIGAWGALRGRGWHGAWRALRRRARGESCHGQRRKTEGEDETVGAHGSLREGLGRSSCPLVLQSRCQAKIHVYKGFFSLKRRYLSDFLDGVGTNFTSLRRNFRAWVAFCKLGSNSKARWNSNSAGRCCWLRWYTSPK